MQAGAGGAENNGGDPERQFSEADWEGWRTRPAAVRGSVAAAQHPLGSTGLTGLVPFSSSPLKTERPPILMPSGVVPLLQVTLPASVRSPGVWFVLAGFVKVAALTMTMGTYPFGGSRAIASEQLRFARALAGSQASGDCPALHCRGAGGPPAHNSRRRW